MIIESKDIVQSPVISVLITTYNQERYIGQSIESVLSQQINVPYELVIAEDCGSDRTREICMQYQAAHPKIIRLLLQEMNKGISGNYADVLSLTRGTYIAQVAGDDFWCDDHKLQIQYDYMVSHPKCGLCYTNVKSCDVNGNIIIEDYLEGKKLSKSFEEHLINPCFIAPLSWMFKRELKDMYENRGYTDESVAMALDAFANFEVYGMNECTAVYRQTVNSASSYVNPVQYFKQNYGVLTTQMYYADKYGCSQELKNTVRLRGILNLLPYAIMTHQTDFVEDSKTFAESIGLDLSALIRYLNDGEVKKQSRAYRLGKALLQPFKWLKKVECGK